MDVKQNVIDKILMSLSGYEIDLQAFEFKLAEIFHGYQVTEEAKSLVPYSEGKNVIFIKRWILSKAIAGCSERTLQEYQNEVSKALSSIGKDADEVQANDIKNFFAIKLMNGCSKSYVDTIRRYLSSFFAFLTKEELIMRNPMNRVDKIKYHKEKKKAFSELEIEKMRMACKTSLELALIEMLLSTGCRAAELVSIRLNDIEDNQIRILGKGQKYRIVYLNAKAQTAVQRYISERKDKNPYLFPKCHCVTDCNMVRVLRANWYKNPLCVVENESAGGETVNSVCKRIAKNAGVQGAHAHRFRRTCATMALRRGMPLELVSKMLGHANIQTTQIYLDIQESDLSNAHEKYVY